MSHFVAFVNIIFRENNILSNGKKMDIEIEVINASAVHGKMTAYAPESDESYEGKYSAILERNSTFVPPEFGSRLKRTWRTRLNRK